MLFFLAPLRAANELLLPPDGKDDVDCTSKSGGAEVSRGVSGGGASDVVEVLASKEGVKAGSADTAR